MKFALHSKHNANYCYNVINCSFRLIFCQLSTLESIIIKVSFSLKILNYSTSDSWFLLLSKFIVAGFLWWWKFFQFISEVALTYQNVQQSVTVIFHGFQYDLKIKSWWHCQFKQLEQHCKLDALLVLALIIGGLFDVYFNLMFKLWCIITV